MFAGAIVKDGGLRRSLEAVSHAEQFNFNRLPAAVALHSSATKAHAEATDRIPVVQEDIEQGQEETAETNAPSTRQKRIADVNSKVSSALSDLADILQGVSLGKQQVSEARHHRAQQATLPRGSTIRIDILSTWGDGSYVGLNGIEVYDDKINLVPFNPLEEDPAVPCIASIAAYPSSLSELPGYEDDPRSVANLLDGINETRDDLHHWLAPQLPLLQTVVSEEAKNAAEFWKEIEDPTGILASIHIRLSHPVYIGT